MCAYDVKSTEFVCVCVQVDIVSPHLLMCVFSRVSLLDNARRFLMARLLQRRVAALFLLILPSAVTNTHKHKHTLSEGHCVTSTKRGTEGRLYCSAVVLSVVMWQHIKRQSPVSMEKVEQNIRMPVCVFLCVTDTQTEGDNGRK